MVKLNDLRNFNEVFRKYVTYKYVEGLKKGYVNPSLGR